MQMLPGVTFSSDCTFLIPGKSPCLTIPNHLMKNYLPNQQILQCLATFSNTNRDVSIYIYIYIYIYITADCTVLQIHATALQFKCKNCNPLYCIYIYTNIPVMHFIRCCSSTFRPCLQPKKARRHREDVEEQTN